MINNGELLILFIAFWLIIIGLYFLFRKLIKISSTENKKDVVNATEEYFHDTQQFGKNRGQTLKKDELVIREFTN